MFHKIDTEHNHNECSRNQSHRQAMLRFIEMDTDEVVLENKTGQKEKDELDQHNVYLYSYGKSDEGLKRPAKEECSRYSTS